MIPRPSWNLESTSLCFRLWSQWRQGSHGASSSRPRWASTNPSDAGRSGPCGPCGSRQPGLLKNGLHRIHRVCPTDTDRFFTPPKHVLIPLCFCRLSNLVIFHVSTESDAQQENPQDSLREHLKKTLEFCLSRWDDAHPFKHHVLWCATPSAGQIGKCSGNRYLLPHLIISHWLLLLFN